VRYDPINKEWAKELTHFDMYPRIFPKEETGCVQEIPGWGRNVVGNVYDNQGGTGKYRFVYPYPLNENYYLVSMKRSDTRTFGLYLVDRFDNITPILELPNDSLLQPIPLQPVSRPLVRNDLIDPDSKTGSMFITDVYAGPGLKGVPRGTAKSLRIFAYHFGFRKSGGHESVGMVSSWDIKRILGTVPVEEDGSASFNVPANTPISIQVLDKNGRAVQVMRSWTVCMPGEQQACIGCHESPLDVTPNKTVKAANRAPSEITPFYGKARPFGYEAEIQPILDAKCIKCHNDDVKKEHPKLPSFEAHKSGDWRTDTSYSAFNPFFWRTGPEPDPDILVPMDYHASVSEFVQKFEKGEHYGVKLASEDWDKINTWIDLNVPYRGQWVNPEMEKRRSELEKLYAGLDTNPEAEYREALQTVSKSNLPPVRKLSAEEFTKIMPMFKTTDNLKVADFPFDAKTFSPGTNGAGEKLTVQLPPPPKPAAAAADTLPGGGFPPYLEPEKQAGQQPKVDLGTGKAITFIKIPAGEYIAGQLDSSMPDEKRRQIVKIGKPFWIAETEITNAQYAVFDPAHDTRYLREDGKDHIVPGYIANHPDQPVARVSFEEAQKYCEWLTKQLKERDRKRSEISRLPTEAQWEWAARAGTATPFWYGDRNADFSKYANLSGKEVETTYTSWENGSTVHQRRPYGENSVFPLRDNRFTDKWFVVDYVKQYEPNPWGLYDVIGNVWEWTIPDADRTPQGKVTAHGGSWKDRPKVAGAAARVVYEPWQKVMNVGFRPVIVDE
jgi:formylglycine-generating enzyme required for sulfatase activity